MVCGAAAQLRRDDLTGKLTVKLESAPPTCSIVVDEVARGAVVSRVDVPRGVRRVLVDCANNGRSRVHAVNVQGVTEVKIDHSFDRALKIVDGRPIFLFNDEPARRASQNAYAKTMARVLGVRKFVLLGIDPADEYNEVFARRFDSEGNLIDSHSASIPKRASPEQEREAFSTVTRYLFPRRNGRQ
jgi:hypothetical protein